MGMENIENVVKTLWSLGESAERLKKVFHKLSLDCSYRVVTEYAGENDCSHPLNPCKACNHCNCGFADHPLDVM